MKRTLTLLGLGLMLSAPIAFAQKQMDQASEKAVQITQGPNVTNITGNSATINWTTNSAGANHVRYRVAGSNSAWKSVYAAGGGTSHSLQLTGLEPGKTYEWQILTRDGDLRTAGQFQSAATATGTAPDVNANAGTAPASPAQGSGDTSGGKVPLYRSANGTGNLHLYTTNAGEQNANGFHAEGTTGYLLSSQGSGTVPLYRMTGSNGDTLLTQDGNQRSAMQAHGYRDDGIIGYIASSQAPGTQPLYQLSSSDGSAHLYTTSSGEKLQFQSQGWKDQGVVGYIYQQ
ncbi:MAG TPA: fibronectin type III domain-containing protein [Candidatus Binatia bacterium]|nr:fibronectin type III domain-containing protein [Candidatus Binatia bacterium]